MMVVAKDGRPEYRKTPGRLAMASTPHVLGGPLTSGRPATNRRSGAHQPDHAGRGATGRGHILIAVTATRTNPTLDTEPAAPTVGYRSYQDPPPAGRSAEDPGQAARNASRRRGGPSYRLKPATTFPGIDQIAGPRNRHNPPDRKEHARWPAPPPSQADRCTPPGSFDARSALGVEASPSP